MALAGIVTVNGEENGPLLVAEKPPPEELVLRVTEMAFGCTVETVAVFCVV